LNSKVLGDEKFIIITFINGIGWGWGKAGQDGSKKSKPIPTPSHLIPPPLRGRENPC